MSYFDNIDDFDGLMFERIDELNEINNEMTDNTETEKDIASILLRAGGRIWNKKGNRIYISRLWKDLLNANVEYYNTGNLKYFDINGDKWSNCQAKKLMEAMDHAYYDIDHKKWVGLGSYESLFNTVGNDVLWKRAEQIN